MGASCPTHISYLQNITQILSSYLQNFTILLIQGKKNIFFWNDIKSNTAKHKLQHTRTCMRIKRANNCMEDFLNSRTINEVIKRKLFHSLIQMLKVILLRNISTGMVQQQTTRKSRIKGDGRRRETLEDRI